MLKVIGASLIACAASLVGFVLSAGIKRRLVAMESAVQAVALLKTVVTLQLQPMQRALEQLSQQNSLLEQLHHAPQEQWPEVLRKYGLGKEEICIFQTLLQVIPRAAAGSSAHFDTALEQLKLQLDLQRRAVSQTAELYPKLGLLCGAAVFLMLI